jgi:peptidyl-prolyl cis-trans isomerase B (cyclophilin B)
MLCFGGFAALLAGCDPGDEPEPASAPPENTAAVKQELTAPPAAEARAETLPPPSQADEQFDFHHQPLSQAIRPEPLPNALPPAQTITGKSIGKLYTEVEKLWPGIRFQTPDGKPLDYTATIDTELGPIEIRLFPEVAPNHVRSFVALARAGYYDSLFFETREGNALTQDSPRVIAAGSPEGDGNDTGSIGYWLLPEILRPDVAAQRSIRHQPGTVGARRGAQPDSASCRFYIALSEAPLWDGEFTIFGQVTRGLEVAEKIFAQPAHDNPGGAAPFVKPPRIEKVTISSQPLESGGRKPENKSN